METYPLKRWAKVIDNVDPDELGRVQVRILPELNGIADDADLPWALPESNSRTGTSPGVGRHSIPDIDSHISVLIVDKYWKLIYYKEESPYVRDQWVYPSFSEHMEIPELETQEYPQPKFERTADGTIKFHNTVTGELGTQHPSGAYCFWDTAGNLFIRAINKVMIKNEDESVRFEIDIENSKITALADNFLFEGKNVVWKQDGFKVNNGSDSAVLFTPLEEVLDELIFHIHIGNTGPTLGPVDTGRSPLAPLKANLSKMKSETVTLD